MTRERFTSKVLYMDEDKLAYHRQYNLRRYHERKSRFVSMLGGKCVKCFSTEDLHFHHKNPATKLFTVGDKMLSYSEKRVTEEVLKCELLCGECHRHNHAAAKGKDVHGTLSSYKYCRCRKCKDAQNAYTREWRRNNQRSDQKKNMPV